MKQTVDNRQQVMMQFTFNAKQYHQTNLPAIILTKTNN